MAGQPARDRASGSRPVPASPEGTPAAAVPPARFDPSRCPLCGQPNACAMETERATGRPQPPCWCTQVDFSAELLARVPTEAQRAACICARCAQAAGA